MFSSKKPILSLEDNVTQAIIRQDAVRVSLLLDEAKAPNTRLPMEKFLKSAVTAGATPVVEALITAGIPVNVNIADEEGNTLLLTSIIKKNVQMALVFIQHPDTNPCHVNNKGESALLLAAHCDLSVVKALIERGAHTQGEIDQVFIGTANSKLSQINDYLCHIVSHDDAKDGALRKAKSRMLFRASGAGKIDVVTALLKAGTIVNWVSPFSNITTLMNAVSYGQDKVVEILLKKPHIYLDWKSPKGETALIIAVQNGEVDIACQLIYAGADIEIRNNDNKTAVDLAYGNMYKKLMAAVYRTKGSIPKIMQTLDDVQKKQLEASCQLDEKTGKAKQEEIIGSLWDVMIKNAQYLQDGYFNHASALDLKKLEQFSLVFSLLLLAKNEDENENIAAPISKAAEDNMALAAALGNPIAKGILSHHPKFTPVSAEAKPVSASNSTVVTLVASSTPAGLFSVVPATPIDNNVKPSSNPQLGQHGQVK